MVGRHVHLELGHTALALYGYEYLALLSFSIQIAEYFELFLLPNALKLLTVFFFFNSYGYFNIYLNLGI